MASGGWDTNQEPSGGSRCPAANVVNATRATQVTRGGPLIGLKLILANRPNWR